MVEGGGWLKVEGGGRPTGAAEKGSGAALRGTRPGWSTRWMAKGERLHVDGYMRPLPGELAAHLLEAPSR